MASLYRAFLFPKTERGTDLTTEMVDGGDGQFDGGVGKLQQLVNDVESLKTAVILTGGGHFAAAIFQGDQVLEVGV